MNNPLGIPDEIFDLMVTSAVKQGISQSMVGGAKRPNPNTPPQRTTPADGAKAAREIFDSYVAAGFNEVQAFELLKLVLTTKR